jgi:hypothetical protein
MKIYARSLWLIASLSVLMFSCNENTEKKVPDLSPNAHKVRAEEVIQTSAYTYVRVSADDRDYWIAVPRMEVKTGETYYWSRGGEMVNFTSKELRRTFRSIFFIEDFSAEPITLNRQPAPVPGSGNQAPAEHKGISVPKAEGGVTIAELYSKRKSFEGKTVKIRGEVVRFSKSIMNRNWVHIQDGTSDGPDFDLTITTQDSVRIGEIVIFEGKVSLEKDFGAGYFYGVILEDARLVK